MEKEIIKEIRDRFWLLLFALMLTWIMTTWDLATLRRFSERVEKQCFQQVGQNETEMKGR